MGKKNRETLSVTIQADQAQAVRKLAYEDNRSLSNYIANLIKQDLKKRGKLNEDS